MDIVIINMIIKGDEWVEFIGELGCEKNTITQLLFAFYVSDKTSITIDGAPITEFTLNSLRSCFDLVQQEPLLFN